MTRKTYPDASEVTKLAVLLETTVEELVDGETGAEYVRRIVRNAGGAWEPPDRIADIVYGLAQLDDNEVEMIRAAVLSAANRKKGESTGTASVAG
jgi:hypothetical protein